jgi:hypothetical protein
MIASEEVHSLQDPSHMGSWSGLTIRGHDDNFLSVITAYQVCRGVLSSVPLGSFLLASLHIYSPLEFPLRILDVIFFSPSHL